MFNGYHETPSTSYNDLELERGKKNQNCSKWPYGNGNVMQWTHLHSQNHQTEIWPPKTAFLGIPNAVNSMSKCSCSACFQMPENQNYQGDLSWHTSWFSRSLPVPLSSSHDQVKLQGNYHWENVSLLNEASQYGGESVAAQYAQENGDKSFFYKPYTQTRLSDIYQSGLMQTMKTCKSSKNENLIKQEGITSNADSPEIIQHGPNINRANCTYEPLRSTSDRKRIEEGSDCYNQNEKFLNMVSYRQPNGPSSYHLHSSNARHAISEAFLKSVPSNVNQNRVPSVGNRNIKENLFHSVNDVEKITQYNANQSLAEEKHCMSLYQIEITKEQKIAQENIRSGHINPFSSAPNTYHNSNVNRDLSPSLSEKDTQKFVNGRNSQYFSKNNFSNMMKNNGQNLIPDLRKDYNFGSRKFEMNPTNINSAKTIHTSLKTTEYGNSKSPDFKKYNMKDCSISEKSSIPDIKIVINPYAKESVDLQSGNGTVRDESVSIDVYNNIRRSQLESNETLLSDKGYNSLQRNLNPFKDYRRPEYSCVHRSIQGPYEYLNGMINLSRNDIPITINQNGMANIQHSEYRNGLDAYSRLNHNHNYDDTYNQFDKIHCQLSGEGISQTIPSSAVLFPPQSSQNTCAKMDKFKHTEKESQFSDKISHLESIGYEKVCKNGTTKISPLRLLRKKKFVQKAENMTEANAPETVSNSKNVTPPLDVRRFWATWAEEEDENVSQTQMVVLDCRNIDPEQEELLHLYEAESVRTVKENGANALGFKTQSLIKDVYDQDVTVYVRNEIDHVNVDKAGENIKASDLMKIDKINGNLNEAYHPVVNNSLRDLEDFENVSDKNYVKSLSTSEALMEIPTNPDSIKETDSVIKIKLSSAEGESSDGISKDIETNHIKKDERESEIDKHIRNFTEKNEISLEKNGEKCKLSNKANAENNSDNKSLFDEFKNSNCESDIAGININKKSIFHSNPTKMEVTDILTNHERNDENSANYKMEVNREFSVSPNSSDDCGTNMPVLPDLPTSEYRKNKFLDYYDGNFYNSNSPSVMNESVVSNSCPDNNTAISLEPSEIEECLCERDTKVNDSNELLYNINESTAKKPSTVKFKEENQDQNRNEIELKSSERSHDSLEVGEVLRKLSEISFQTKNDNLEIIENSKIRNSVSLEKCKTEKKKLIYKKERKSKKLHHREKSSRIDEFTFQNLSPVSPSVQFSIQKSHDLKISFRVLNNTKIYEEHNLNSYEDGHKEVDVEREGNDRIDVNERRRLFAVQLKDLPEFNIHKRNEKTSKDFVRRKKKELKKRKMQSDRLSMSKNPLLKIKRSRYVTAEDCSEIIQTSESFKETLDDLWRNCENDSKSSDGFQVHETVDSAKIKLTFKRHKKNMENKKNSLPNDEVTEAENKTVDDSIALHLGPENFDKSKGNPIDFEDADPEPNVEDVNDEIKLPNDSKIKNEEMMNSFVNDDECFTQKIHNCEGSKPITHLSSIITEEPISGGSLKVSEFSVQKNNGDTTDYANINGALVSMNEASSSEDSANFNENCLNANAVIISNSYSELEVKPINDNKMRKEEKEELTNLNDQNSNFCDSIDKSSFSEANDGMKFLNENLINDNHKLEVNNVIFDVLDKQTIEKEETNCIEKTILNKVDGTNQIFKKFEDLIKDEKMKIDENFELKKIKEVIKSTNNEVLCVLETNSKSLITNSDCNSICNIKAEDLTSAGSYSQNEELSKKLPEEDAATSDFQEFNLEIKSSSPQIDSNLNKNPTNENEIFNGGNIFNKYAVSKSGNTDCIKCIETDTVYEIVQEKSINTAQDIKFTTFDCCYDTFSCASLNEDVEKSADDQPMNEIAIETNNRNISFNSKPDFEFNVASPDIHSKRDNEKCSDESIKKNNCNSIEIQEIIVETFKNEISNNESAIELKNGSYDILVMNKNKRKIYEDHADDKTEFIYTVEEDKCMNETKKNSILKNVKYDNRLITENVSNNENTPHLNFTVEKVSKFSELIDKENSVLSNKKNFGNMKTNSEDSEITLNSSVLNNIINATQVEEAVPVSNHKFIASTISKEIIASPEHHFLVSGNLYSYAKENVSMEKKTNDVTKKFFPKSERKIFRRFSSENGIHFNDELKLNVVEEKNIFSSTRSRSKSLNLDFISFSLDKKETESSETEEVIQSNIPVYDIPLPPGNPPLENCFDLEQYLKNRLSSEKMFAKNENKEKKNNFEISHLPRAFEHCILKSQKDRFLTAKALNCEDCQSPFLHSGSVKFRNPSPPCEEISIMKHESLSCQTTNSGKVNLRNPSPPFDENPFHSTDVTNTKEFLVEKVENSTGDFNVAEFSSLLKENIKSSPEVSKTREFQCFPDIAQKTQASEGEFVSDKLDDLYIKCFAMENCESKVTEEGGSEDIQKIIETVKKIDCKEPSKSFALICDMDKLNSSAECFNENLNRFTPDTDTIEGLNFVDYSEINHQIMNVKENEVIVAEESIFKTDQFYECEKHALYESLAITDDIEVEKVSDDDKFLNVMQNCLENAKKFLNIGNLKPFSYSVDDLLEIDNRAAETCPPEAELDNSNHVSKDVLLSSFEGNPSEELVVEDNIEPVEISLDIMPSFCPDADSNLCSEILPVNNWPYLEEEVSSSPMRNISDETDLLSSCLENDLPMENSNKSLSENENIGRSYSNKKSMFCRNIQDSQLYTRRKSRRVSLSVAESSTFLRGKQQRENMALSVNGHSKFVLQRRRTVEGLLDEKKIHSETDDVKGTDEKIPNTNCKDFEKLSFLLKDLKCRLDMERLSSKKDIINDNKVTKKSMDLDVFRRKLDEGELYSDKNDNAAKEKQKLVNDKNVKVCSSHKTKRINEDHEECIDKKKIKTRTNYKSSAWQPKVVLFRISKNVIKTFSMRPHIKNDLSLKKIDSPRSSEKFQDHSFKTSPGSLYTSEKRSSERDGDLDRKKNEIFGDVEDQISQVSGKFAMLEKSRDDFSRNIVESTNNKKRKKQRFRNLHPKKKLVPEAFNKTKENQLAAQNNSKPVNSESDSDFTSPECYLPKDIFHSQLKSTKSSCFSSQNLKEPSTKDDNINSVEHLVPNKLFKEHQIRSGDNSKPKIASKCSGSSDKKKEYNDNNYNKNHNNKESDRHIYSYSTSLKNSDTHKKKECSDGRKECRKESKRKRDEEQFNREVGTYNKERNHLKNGERRLSALENRTGQSDLKKISREANDHYQSVKQKCKEWKNLGVSGKNSSSKSKNSKSKRDSMKKSFWVCEVCGFNKSSERVIHIQSHPFHCQSCHLAFKTESNFLEHLRRKHKDIRNQHHCLLCELSFDLEKEYYQHLETREHRHLESVEKNTINTLFTLLTGHPCPVLGPVESKSEWLPSQAGTVHFYHQATPLSLALQYLKLHHEKRTISNPTLTPQSE